jgi:hypothetical protein
VRPFYIAQQNPEFRDKKKSQVESNHFLNVRKSRKDVTKPRSLHPFSRFPANRHSMFASLPLPSNGSLLHIRAHSWPDIPKEQDKKEAADMNKQRVVIMIPGYKFAVVNK